MLDYDLEAARYDETRGGLPRARAAAEALHSLLPEGTRTVLDVAGGTGLVASCLARLGLDVVVCDRSLGMLRLAAGRRPGRCLCGDATRMAARDRAVDAVVLVWLLHLLPDAAPVLAECARVLRPGGVLVTTVDKNAAHAGREVRRMVLVPDPADARERVTDVAGRHGLAFAGEARFLGHGQAQRPPEYTLVAFSKPA